MNKYTGITIGPIVATLCKARKTREIWAASYLFSLIMRKIVIKLAGEKGENNDKIIVPFRSCENTEKENIHYKKLESELLLGTGLYMDHIIYEGEIANLDEHIATVISEVACLLTPLNREIVSSDIIKKFLNSYIQIYWFEFEALEKDYFDIANNFFNSVELQSRITPEDETYNLAELFKQLHDTPFYKGCFSGRNISNDKTYFSVKSIIEIATSELGTVNNLDYDTDEEKIIVQYKDYKNFRNYHKYYALVQCDGDKMGSLIKELARNNSNALKRVSNALFDWAIESVTLIQQCGGLPIYAGGDDLLFFAPIHFKKQENGGDNVVWLMKQINDIFCTKTHNLISSNDRPASFVLPSLSFGASVAYYKYPLNEARETGLNLMYDMKTGEGNSGNGIRIKLLRHSNSDFDMTLKFNDTSYEIFNAIMAINILDESKIRGVTRTLREHQDLFDHFPEGENNKCEREKRIDNFFINKVEGYNANDALLKQVLAFVKLKYAQPRPQAQKPKAESRMLAVYDMLRTIKFLKGIEETK